MPLKKRPKVLEKFPPHQNINKSKLAEEAQNIQLAYQRLSPKDFMLFVRGLRIDSQTGGADGQLFDPVMAYYQRQTFEEMAPNIHALRDGEMPDIRRYWIERTKKASKDADLAIIALWLIAFPIRPFYGQIGAGDKSQAAIVKDRIVHLLHLNPWLNEHIEVVQWQIKSKKKLANGDPMARIDIMSADIAGAHGGTPDILIINELTHITRWEFAENLMDNADGVAQGIVIIATNAGFKGTKAEVWRNNALSQQGSSWLCYILAKPAPWHSKETIAEAKRRDQPPSRFNRLWKGKWASGKGDALDEDQLDNCFRISGPIENPEPGWVYVLGVDLGISHDHSGLVALGIHTSSRRIKLVYMKAWEPDLKTHKVNLINVQTEIIRVAKWLRASAVYLDPSEAQLMMQQISLKIDNVISMTFSSGANCTLMATCLLQVVEDGILELYDDQDGRLRRDFGKFNIVEKPYGFKLEATRDEFGHADVGTALVIALPFAVEMLKGIKGLGPEDDLVVSDDTDLTDEEIKELPSEFKELIENEEEVRTKHRIKKRVRDPFEDIS